MIDIAQSVGITRNADEHLAQVISVTKVKVGSGNNWSNWVTSCSGVLAECSRCAENSRANQRQFVSGYGIRFRKEPLPLDKTEKR